MTVIHSTFYLNVFLPGVRPDVSEAHPVALRPADHRLYVRGSFEGFGWAWNRWSPRFFSLESRFDSEMMKELEELKLIFGWAGSSFYDFL